MILDIFHKAFLINLDKRQDRLERSRGLLAGLGVDAERFPAHVHKHPAYSPIYKIVWPEWALGIYGCLTSHLEILHRALDEGMPNVLIFEDDFKPCENFSQRWKVIHPHLAHIDWDLFYFYGGGGKNAKNVEPRGLLGKLNANPWRTHVYAVNGKFVGRLIHVIENAKNGTTVFPLDAIYVNFCRGNIYAPLGSDLMGQFGDDGTEGDSDIPHTGPEGQKEGGKA